MSHSLSFVFLFSLLLLNTCALTQITFSRSTASVLNKNLITSEAFRQQDLTPELYEQLTSSDSGRSDLPELLTTSMLNGHFHPDTISAENAAYLLYKKSSYLQLKNYYKAIWNDLQYFPVASADIYFENSWMETRTYGSSRHHEGTDLFGPVNISGYYPVISITDGIIEQKGWLPLGGYRIGVRSVSGGYFYYAHLSSYEEAISQGKRVSAGDILGFMGNTGYGDEGTSGMFPVHLHLGIYIHTPEGQEISVNPYPVLQCLRKKIRNCIYY